MHVLDTTLKWREVSKVCIIMGDMEVARVSKETLIKHTDRGKLMVRQAREYIERIRD